jgi:hypothetical protein
MPKTVINTFIHIVLSRPRRILGVTLIFTLFFLYCFFQQSHNNHIEVFFESGDDRYATYQKFQQIFGNEEFSVVALEHENLFTNNHLAIIRELTDALKRVSGVDRVVSITNVEEFFGTEDAIMLRRIVPKGRLSPAELADARARALDNRFVSDHILTPDARMTALHVELEALKEAAKRKTSYAILDTAKQMAGAHFDLYCSGPSFVEVEMNRLSERDFKTFIPVILILIFILMVILLRQFSLALLCEVNLLVILIWAVGLYVLCGEQFNIITNTMGAILLAIAIADSIHILSHLKETIRRNHSDMIPALKKTIRQVWFPCLFTSLTTGAGFLSFAASDIRPVAILGIFTAVGVVLAFFLSMTTLPPLIILNADRVARSLARIKADPQTPGRNDRFTRGLKCVGRLAVRWRWLFFVLSVAVLILAVFGMGRLRFETNTFNYLPDSNRIKSDFRVIEKHFGGTIPFVVWIKAEEKRAFENPETVRRIQTIQHKLLSDNPDLTHAFSIVNYLREFNQAIHANDPAYYKIPDSHLDIADAYELGDPAVLDRNISLDHRQIAVTFLTIWKSNEAGYRLHSQARQYLSEKLGNGFAFHITGLSSLYLKMDKNLQEGQQRSFGIAFTIIFFVMLFVCRSFWLAVFSMVPNLFPIIMTLGLMGWFGIPLDVATTMIASVTIGIAVDDTIHFIAWMRRNSGLKKNAGDVVVQTFADVGKPIAMTTFLLFCGFFVLVLGSILPTKMFGMLTAFAMAFALIGDMFVLAPLILIFKPHLPPLPVHGED